MERQTMTTLELANFIGVSKDLIYQMVRENKLPFVRIGRRILFRKEAIVLWMNHEETKNFNMDPKIDDY
ncbi:excisionase family DNA-binding protein [Priestia megaterium]|uniref:excisionase family DNA-binding protein n=1 Tax=Priestia megaterium TaxID=1404 RepID=UPI00287768D3|nr:excisionase family DNA-binding protein [Priestia megaterium]